MQRDPGPARLQQRGARACATVSPSGKGAAKGGAFGDMEDRDFATLAANVTDNAALRLAAYLEKNETLTHLDARYNSINAETLNALALPLTTRNYSLMVMLLTGNGTE